MANAITSTPRLDHFFSAPAARLDRWREPNAKRKPDPLGPAGYDSCCHLIESTVTQSSGVQAC
jgi:hypothetical protein